LPYILEQTKSVLTSGDVVLLPLEYYHYGHNEEFSSTLIDYIVSRDADYFRKLNYLQKTKVIFSMTLPRLLSGLKNKIKPTWFPCKGVYCIENMNEFGDQVNIHPEDRTALHKNRLNTWDSTVVYPSITTRFKRDFVKYIQWAKRNRIEVKLVPTHIIDDPIYHSSKGKDFFNKILSFASQQGIPFVGDFYNHIYDIDNFFNGQYHLNSVGVDINTKILIEELMNSSSV